MYGLRGLVPRSSQGVRQDASGLLTRRGPLRVRSSRTLPGAAWCGSVQHEKWVQTCRFCSAMPYSFPRRAARRPSRTCSGQRSFSFPPLEPTVDWDFLSVSCLPKQQKSFRFCRFFWSVRGVRFLTRRCRPTMSPC